MLQWNELEMDQLYGIFVYQRISRLICNDISYKLTDKANSGVTAMKQCFQIRWFDEEHARQRTT